MHMGGRDVALRVDLLKGFDKPFLLSFCRHAPNIIPNHAFGKGELLTSG
jgi:hypothetical protein